MTGSLRTTTNSSSRVNLSELLEAKISMSKDAAKKFLAAINRGEGLRDEFIYYMGFEEYKSFPDPIPRTAFTAQEVQESVQRYPNPEKPRELFRWDIHGRLLTPARPSIPGVAVVMIHGGAANEYEFLFTPDGPEKFLDLTQIPPGESRAGIAQHIASLGVTVLAISLPGHYSRQPWPPIATRRPEFVIGEIPGDKELENRLAVYTFRMCLEAIKLLIERHLPEHGLYMWGHSTGGEYFYLMEQYGLKNRLIGGLGFGTGMPAWLRKEWDLAAADKSPEERAKNFRAITNLTRRSPEGYVKSGYADPTSRGEVWSGGLNSRITAVRSSSPSSRTSSTAPTTSCWMRSEKYRACRMRSCSSPSRRT